MSPKRTSVGGRGDSFYRLTSLTLR